MSLPQLAFDCMLKITEADLELITNIDQYLFVESGIRGGLSFINQRYAESGLCKKIYTYLEYIDGKAQLDYM